jgi:hypothetical protein
MTQQEQLAANAAFQAQIQAIANLMKAHALIYAAAQKAKSDGQYLCDMEAANALVPGSQS